MQNSLIDTCGILILLFSAFMRGAELLVSGRNQAKLLQSGFRRRDSSSSYRMMVIMHTSFFIICWLEYLYVRQDSEPIISIMALIVFIAAQAVRFTAIYSLGYFWNTNVMTADQQKGFVASGPYRYIKHPNYLAVILEFAAIPLILGAWRSAIIYSIWNAIVLRERISLEEKELAAVPGYSELMGKKARFIPGIF